MSRFTILYLLIDILEYIGFEVLKNEKKWNDGNKWYYLAICLIFLSLFRKGKFLTSVYFSNFIVLQILKIAFEEQKGIELINRIRNRINQKIKKFNNKIIYLKYYFLGLKHYN